MSHQTDIVIVGSGFGGTLLAVILRQMGYSVAIVEKEDHPRFRIGESSTPIADLILRDLSQTYDLPWLMPLSRYGTWKSTHPEIRCGIKRGFSYYFHKRGLALRPDSERERELLVAASASNERSDTQWYRADTDQFFLSKAIDYGVQYFRHSDIVEATYSERQGWTLVMRQLRLEETQNSTPSSNGTLRCNHLVDATGSSHFGDRFLNTTSDASDFQTHSSALFTHLDGVPRWLDILKNSGFDTDPYPYDPDLSALHHLIDEGWIWMLRFDNERLSIGLMFDRAGRESTRDGDAGSIVSAYPSLATLLSDGVIADPPGQWIRTERLQRLSLPAVGKGWMRLPYSVGFVDPMHSTGIAHTLTGVERVAAILDPGLAEGEAARKRQRYGQNVVDELRLIDRLVAGAYQTRHRPALFEAWLSWYFVLAIDYEQFRLAGIKPDSFLQSDRTDLTTMVMDSYERLQDVLQSTSNHPEPTQTKTSHPTPTHSKRSPTELIHPESTHSKLSPTEQAWIQRVRNQIKPYNKAGLLDPAANRLYKHTAVDGL